MKFHTSANSGRERPVRSRKKLMNVEHRTLNVQHRIMYSIYQSGSEQNASSLQNSIRLSPAAISSGPNGSRQAVVPFYLISTKRSVIIIRCSMLDVRCSTFNLFTASAECSITRVLFYGFGGNTPKSYISNLTGVFKRFSSLASFAVR